MRLFPSSFSVALLQILFIALLPLGAQARTAERLPPPVAAALKQAGIPFSNVGLFVQAADGKRPLLTYGADRSFNPASTMKLVTTYASLGLLGPAHTWKTEVFTDGDIRNGVLYGDLVLKGGGDPSLTLPDFWVLLRELRERGLRDIKGDLVLDRRYFANGAIDPGAFDNEPHRAYNVGPDGLLLNFNVVRVRIVPEGNGQMLAVTTDPMLPGLVLDNHLAISQGECGDWREGIKSDVHGGAGVTVLTLSGSFAAACGEKTVNLNVLGPRDYVFGVFKALWAELGGSFSGRLREGEPSEGRLPYATYSSPPLADVIRDINKFSNNVMARQVFLTLGAEGSGTGGTVENSARAVAEWLHGKNMDFPELVLENGAGLSRIERINARHMGELLLDAYHSPVFSELESSLPIVAVDGTMKKRLTDDAIAGHAHIKTGYLEGVRAIAGYVFDRKGHRVVVVCFMNHPNAKAGKPALDALLDWVYTTQ